MCSNAHGVSNNVELKTLDATANPYIALAAIITAGLLVRSVPCMAKTGNAGSSEHKELLHATGDQGGSPSAAGRDRGPGCAV